MEQKPARPADASRDKVPDALVDQLHDANAHFHAAKKEMEAAMDDSEYDHTGRVEANTDKVKDAEREVEDVTQKIHKATGWPTSVKPPT
jgi:hypothetical protein